MATETDTERLHDREQLLRRAYDLIATPEKPFPRKVDDLFDLVCERLDTDFATLSRVHEDAGEYIFERVECPESVGVDPGHRTDLSGLPNCAHVVESRETLVLRDVAAEKPAFFDETWGVACYLGAPVVVDGEVYGTFCFYDTEPRADSFSDWEVTLVELLSDWASYELTRQRYIDRVCALNELNGTVRAVVDAVIDQPSREAVETVACESLAETDIYDSAWIAERDRDTGTLSVRAAAGVSGVLDGVPLSGTPEDEASPPALALDTGHTQIRQSIRTGGPHDAWNAHAEAFGYRSSLSVPVAHADAVYGVLTVHSAREEAFDREEAAALDHLGAMLGHATAAIERKRALTAETVVELTLGVRDVLGEWGVEESLPEPVQIQDLVSVDDDTYIAYGTVPEAGFDAFAELSDSLSFLGAIERTGGRGGDVAFEIRTVESPTVSRVAALGGHVESVLFDGRDLRATVRVSPTVDVAHIVDAFAESYPGVYLVRKRERARPTDAGPPVARGAVEDLTDRQFEALRTAYFAGYFERPRETSGQEVAERLGIANSTFSQHLRTAQAKLFEALFEQTEREQDEAAESGDDGDPQAQDRDS